MHLAPYYDVDAAYELYTRIRRSGGSDREAMSAARMAYPARSGLIQPQQVAAKESLQPVDQAA